MGGADLNNTQVQMIAVDMIDMVHRLREPDPAAVAALAADMAQRGLRSPIEVVKATGKAGIAGRYVLVAGGHRLCAAISLGWAVIPAFAVTGRARELRRDELMENLAASELTYLERAQFVHELRVIWEQENRDSATRHGGDRRSEKFQDESDSSWSAAIVQRSGLSLRVLQKADAIGKALPANVADQIRHTKLAHQLSELEALAKMGGELQGRVAKAIATGQAKSVSEAKRVLAPTEAASEADADEAAMALLLRAWNKASEQARSMFLHAIGMTTLEDE